MANTSPKTPVGVVEAASSSLVTQTRKSIENSRFLCFFLCFLAELYNFNLLRPHTSMFDDNRFDKFKSFIFFLTKKLGRAFDGTT